MSARILVVYFSRSGHTQKIAEEIARSLGADLEAISDPTPRSGFAGYLRCGFEASFKRLVEIAAATHDPGEYDLVIVGTPIWDMSLSSPVRSYLHRYQDRLKAVAFFCTCGGSGGDRVFAQMARVSGHAPVATLIVREAELDAASASIARFANELAKPKEPRPARPAPSGPVIAPH